MGHEYTWGAATHPGRVRQVNQDAVLAGPDLFVVADGMGGHAAGDVASSMAIATIAEATDADDVTSGSVLRAIEQANVRILEAAGESGQREGMGTTIALVARCVDHGAETLLVANVGDSRVYEWRAGELTQISVDHSVVGELLASGAITASEAETHAQRHTITRALGLLPGIEVDWVARAPEAGVRYLVCSDGLTNEVSHEELAARLSSGGEAAPDAQALLDMALERGARDNVSVVVLDVGVASESASDGPPTIAREAGHDTRPRVLPASGGER